MLEPFVEPLKIENLSDVCHHVGVVFNTLQHVGNILKLIVFLPLNVRLDRYPVFDVVGERVDQVVNNYHVLLLPVLNRSQILDKKL